MFLKAYKEGVQKVFGTLDLFVSLLETEIKYPILQGGILPFWTPSFLLNIFFTFPQHFRFHFILVPFKLPAGMSVLAEVRPIKEIILYFCPAKSNYMLSFSAYGPKTISEKT